MVQVCCCDPGKGEVCDEGSGCLCRDLQVECTPGSCPAGDRCRNQRLQSFCSRPCTSLAVQLAAGSKGWGLYTLQALDKGDLVCVYVGEVVGSKTAAARQKLYAEQGRQHQYMMWLSSNEVVDATQRGGKARFANHSCSPNCRTEKWSVGTETLVGLFTLQPLAPGEEITYNYQFTWFGEAAVRCQCGAPSCSGILGRSSSSTSMAGGGGLGGGGDPPGEEEQLNSPPPLEPAPEAEVLMSAMEESLVPFRRRPGW